MIPRRPRRSNARRRSVALMGLLLAASATLVASKATTRTRTRTRTIRVLPPEEEAADPPASSAVRFLKKTPNPTYYPTEEPKSDNKKPKKTDPPTYFPTESFPPSASPTFTPRPTNNPIPTAPTRKPTPGPTATPTMSMEPSGSPTSLPSVSFEPTGAPSSVPSTSQSPSSFPTESPSGTPSSNPSAVPSMSPTSSAMPSMAPIPYARAERVEVRHLPWSELSSDAERAAAQLAYDESTWNVPGTNPVEYRDWDRLERVELDAAERLGYDRFSWDCWQNHFQSYRWIDLGLPYVQVLQWWEELGWDIYNWNMYTDAPESDEKSWYELSMEERDAAAQLCYFREAWDGKEGDALVDGFPIERPEFRYVRWWAMGREERERMDEAFKYSALTWNVLGLADIERKGWGDLSQYETGAAEDMGFNMHNWDCWQNHFRSYAWEDLEFYGLDFPYRALGWTALSWDDGVESPPPSASTAWKDLTTREREVASELCYFRDNWDGLDMTPSNGDFRLPKPKRRYVEWAEQPADARRTAADSLGYDEETWNKLGTAPVERRGWEELTEHQKADAMTLGFYRRTWDCFQNHYRSYKWYDLDRDGRDALQVLGWSETSWENGVAPPSYDNEWARLSEMEQTTAAVLCFFEDNWDGNSLEVVSDLVITEEGVVVESGFILDTGADGLGGLNSDGSTGGGSYSGGSNTGGSNTGGAYSGGSNTGGSNAGGSNASGSNAGGSNASGSNAGVNAGGSNEGGANAVTADGQVANTVSGKGVDVVTLKPNAPANSANITGMTRKSCILSLALGTFIRYLL